MPAFSQAIEAVANDAGNCEATWTVPVGRALRLTRMAALGTSLVLPPSSEELSQRYRGVWDGTGPLVYTQDFAGGTSLPAGIAIDRAQFGSDGRVSMTDATPIDAGEKPPHAYAWRVFDGGATTPTAAVRVDASTTPALAGVQVTKISAYMLTRAGTPHHSYSTKSGVKASGDTVWESSQRSMTTIPPANTPAPPTTWELAEARVTGAGPFTFGTLDEFYAGYLNPPRWLPDAWGSELFVTGIKVYGLTADSAYVLNDTVAYGGYLWLCTASNTTSVPGTDGTWEQIAGTRSATGYPVLMVYRNGSLIDSTGNANSDLSTLDINLNPGDNIRAVWSKVSGGALMRLTLDGDE